MATIGTTALSLADWAARVDDNYKTATIVEILSMTNEILLDMLTMEANGVTGHKTTVRTGLPSGTWRLLNYGIVPTKSTTAPIVDTPGNLEAESQIDVDLLKLNGNSSEFRLSESMAFLEGMNQQMAQTMIYGNQGINPERFTGLAPRYNTVTTTSAQTAFNVIDAGGVGSDNTSAWFVTWGDQTTHCFFPKGSRAGLTHSDKGEQRVQDTNQTFATSAYYWAMIDHYKWELGLSVRDWRYNVRIANIDVSDLSTANAANIINALIRAANRLPTTGGRLSAVTSSDTPKIAGSMGKTCIYVNRTVRTFLELQVENKTNILLRLQEWDGMTVMTFRGIPIRTVDAILNTEARVT